MSSSRDSKHLLAALAPLCVMLALLAAHYRRLAEQRVDPADVATYEQLADRNIDFTTDLYGLRYQGSSSNYIDANILYYGAYEKPLLTFLEDAARAMGKGPIVFVDVGANTGQHTIFASRFSRRVHAFEPYPPVLERLRGIVALNHLTNVTVHPVGLGAEDALLDFHDPSPENLGTGSFVGGPEQRTGAVEQLQIVAGDRYFEKAGIEPVDLMKIDVEGYEKPVLQGLRRTIERDRPLIVTEVSKRPGEEPFFQSKEQLLGALPQNYELALLVYHASDLLTGGYEILPFDFSFAGQLTVVAYPSESARTIPRSGSGSAPTDGERD